MSCTFLIAILLLSLDFTGLHIQQRMSESPAIYMYIWKRSVLGWGYNASIKLYQSATELFWPGLDGP